MRILGINSAYHESSASLVIDGKIIAAVASSFYPSGVDNCFKNCFKSCCHFDT